MFNVFFISESVLKGKKRVIAVLDRYATRVGNEIWTTPITQQGLEVVQNLLKSIATKQTHVACFKKTPMGNKLLFSIGKPIIRENDAIAVHSHIKKKRIMVPEYIKDSTIINRIAGLFHDVGKLSSEFQSKIRLTQEEINKDRASLSDSVRHELISYYLFNEFEKNIDIDFQTAWINSENEINKFRCDFINEKISTWQDLVRFVILTHHKLPANNKEHKFLLKSDNTLSNYFKNKEIPKNKISIITTDPNGECIKDILKEIVFLLKRMKYRETNKNSDYWFALSYLCRTHFILADHEQSSISLKYQIETNKNDNDQIYANTHINNKNLRRYFNQDLRWHLKHVADRSSQLLFEISNMKNYGLNINTIKSIITKTDNPKFEWQNKSIDFMKNNVSENSQVLILNIAGTGRGKTRSNVSTLASLNQNRNDGKPFRFSTLLNLKTLTLQTIEAYHNQLNIPKNEMLGVIGDKAMSNLYDSKNEINKNIISNFLNNDELETDDSIEDPEIVTFNTIKTPEFLDIILNKSVISENKKINISTCNKNSQMISSPVMVSTIDFMINAGDLSKQKKHSLSFLRLMNSDLILDEIDSYDPKALVAVCRIIMLSAMFGNNIICSSATLSEHSAELIFNSYKKGFLLRKGMINGENINSEVIIIDDKIDVSSQNMNNIFDFQQFYSKHLFEYFNVKTKSHKKAKILNFQKNISGLEQAISKQILSFHEDFKFKLFDKNISFGLIRIANINEAVYLSKYISADENLKNKVRICCYHSQLTVLHRHYIEENLDFILKRGKKEENYTKSDLLKHLINKSNQEDLIFIVVATPVEEIGRDHDFDWCICEPSSTQSIVQTAGRVNRHREVEVSTPNFAILNYNFRNLKGENVIFCKPGLDQDIAIPGTPSKTDIFSKQKKISIIKSNYKKYAKDNLNITDFSMKNLLNEVLISQKLDASLKFAKTNGKEVHLFSLLDNYFLKFQLNNFFQILNNDKLFYHFYNQSFYNYYSLRENDGLDCSVDIEQNIIYYKDSSFNKKIKKDEKINNAFLDPYDDLNKMKQTKKIMKNNNINYNCINIKMYYGENIGDSLDKYFYHPNFGMYRKIF